MQKAIIRAVSQGVRCGGYLLYSTCSTEPEENEAVVNGFLEENAGFRLIRPVQPAGIERWLDGRGFLRTYPSERLWDGFFAALMIRES